MSRAEERRLIAEVESFLQKKFNQQDASKRQVPSTALPLSESERLKKLFLPDNSRARMPLTKDKYIVKEDDELIAWEREVRKFLRNLSPEHGHRVSAAMVYEWATGITVKDSMEMRTEDGKPATRVRADLRRINKILKYYFGKPYMTTIANRKVPKCYRVRQGYYIRRHRPMTVTLWAEYREGVLYP